MGWRESLLPASFRGVPFEVLSHEAEGGRRLHLHQYAQRDTPYAQDLGRQGERFRLRAFVVGDDYHLDRDRLLDVLRNRPAGYPANSSGQLVHPYLGSMRVSAKSWRLTEESESGRWAQFELEFVESGFLSPPAPTGANPASVDAASSSASAAVGDELEENLNTTGPAPIQAATSSTLADIGAALQDLAVLEGTIDDVQAFSSKVTGLINQAADLALQPVTLVTSVTGAVDAIETAAGNALASLGAYETLFGLEPAKLGGSSSTDQKADENAQLVADLARTAAVGGAARAAARISWESLDAAEAARDRILDQIDLELDGARAGAYGALAELRRRVTDAVPPPNEKLPRIRTLVIPESLPAAVIAYRLNDDASGAAALAARNGVPHPGFMPAGQALQVLTSG